MEVPADFDLNETVKVFVLTHVTGSPPVFVTMRSGYGANTGYDVIDFIITCIQQGMLVAGDILVLDNASSHKRRDVMGMFVALLRAAQVTVVFLPTYSPELNPCELVLAQNKHYLRYHRRLDRPFWYEIAHGFAETSLVHMLNYYYKCIWNV